MAIDPICGMHVDELKSISAQRHGQTFYFCCEHCRKKFLSQEINTSSDPDQLLQLAIPRKTIPGGSQYFCPMCAGIESDKPGSCPKCGMALESSNPSITQHKTIYTCPMHPEIAHDGPGTCPICGMNLEPKRIGTAEEDDSELRNMSRRFWGAIVLTIPVFLLAMLPMLGVPLDQWLGAKWYSWLQLVLSTPVVLWAGWPFFERGWRSIVTWNLNMFTLIAIGTGAAYLYSLWRYSSPDSFRIVFDIMGMLKFISKQQRSLLRWSCWGRYWNFLPGGERERPFVNCFHWHHFQHDLFGMALKWKYRWSP